MLKVDNRRLENGIMEFIIHNETHTLLRPLTEELRKHPDITFVSYVEIHPLKKQMKLLVKSKDNNEIDIILKTIMDISSVLKIYSQQINESFDS